jgi:hypothetical protein
MLCIVFLFALMLALLEINYHAVADREKLRFQA